MWNLFRLLPRKRRAVVSGWRIGFSGEEQYPMIEFYCDACHALSSWSGGRHGFAHVPVVKCIHAEPYPMDKRKFAEHLQLRPVMPKEPSSRTANPVRVGKPRNPRVSYVQSDPG